MESRGGFEPAPTFLRQTAAGAGRDAYNTEHADNSFVGQGCPPDKTSKKIGIIRSIPWDCLETTLQRYFMIREG